MERDEFQRMSRHDGASVRLGLLIGIVWTLVQFGLSEGFYQLGNQFGADSFYTVSDVVSWPAGLIYHQVEVAMYQKEFAKLNGTEEERKAWEELMVRFDDYDYDDEAYDEIWKVFDAKSVSPYVDTVTEYSIYFGVCVAWGFFVGIIVAFGHSFRKGI